MTRTITRSEFQNAAGEAVYVSHVHYMSRAEQIAGDAACQAVVVPAAFVPALSAGPAFDSPESTTTGWPGGVTSEPAYREWQAAENERLSRAVSAMATNCEGFAHAGEALAHAQHEAAVDGLDCTSGACLITRGSD